MSQPGPLRVLVAGDPYMPATAWDGPLSVLHRQISVTSLQIQDVAGAPPRTGSERLLREYAGVPAEVAPAVAGHDVLVVHGAPVSAEVLRRRAAAAGVLRPRRPGQRRRGGRDRARHPGVNTPGKNAEAVAELTIAFALLLIRGVPRASRHLTSGGSWRGSVFDGREFFGQRSPRPDPRPGRLRHVGRQVAGGARRSGSRVLATTR